MNFFFHSELGAVYFVALIAICAFAILRGGKDMRLFGYCVLGVFFADRVLLATMNNEEIMIGLGGVAEFIAFGCIITYTTIKAGKLIAFLFAVKLLAYIALLGGVIEFPTMAAWTELSGYCQLLVMIGGMINDNRGKLGRNVLFGGSLPDGGISAFKSRLEAERTPRIHTGND